ncbi:DNA-binding protein [Streptomyces sp. NPDC001410]|uniref:DNA-binding protein n=1 Tax=Streptomyces sp. NPDC001410 TaxID=3364574 RepID=UPI0036ABF706
MADDDVDFLPGDGPTSGISVTLTAGTLQAIRERVGKRGVSAHLEKAVQRDRELHEWLTAARDADLPVITSAAVLVEVIHPKINNAALKWTLSRLRVEPVTQSVAQSAAALLPAAGLHGHKYAIDAMLCATVLQHPGRVTILTPDVEDIGLLTAGHPRVSAEKA